MEGDAPSQVHSHCESCYRKHCLTKERLPVACPQISCKNGCGAVYHDCKGPEHIILCPLEKVPCINLTNGCPMVLNREKMSAHLVTCPASVIYCTMEWNRWPVYSEERQARVPFSQSNLHAKYGQLDVSLALRDQRVLNDAMKVPRKTRRALRNKLTQRFPAVPLATKHSSFEPDTQLSPLSDETSEEDDSDAPWIRSKNPPGLQRTVCGELFQASREATESLTAALSMVTEHPQLQTASDAELSHRLTEQTESQINCADDGTMSTTGTDVPLHINCDNHPSPGSKTSPFPGYLPSNMQTDLISEFDSLKMTEKQEAINKGAYAVTVPDPPKPPAPPTSLMLQHILGLDLNLESITRYQIKPKSMYTFLCAKAFKRSEYAWHFQNVHCDIHSHLNGWLEQRCPMATYGCTYSIRRLYPDKNGSTVIYSPLLESFGIRSRVPSQLASLDNGGNTENVIEYCDARPKQKEPTPEIFTSKDYDAAIQVNGNLHRREPSLSPPRDADILSTLPMEVILHITKFLDGFSLSNLALTCSYLRDVCCTLLDERGLVIQEWEKQTRGGRAHWFLAHKRWQFSTSFEPVKKWIIGEHPHLSDHLKVCPFNRTQPRTDPWRVLEKSPEDPFYYRTIQQMYPNFKPPEPDSCFIESEASDQ